MRNEKRFGNVPEAPAATPESMYFPYRDGEDLNFGPLVEAICTPQTETTCARLCVRRATQYRRFNAIYRLLKIWLSKLGLPTPVIKNIIQVAGELVANGFFYGQEGTRVQVNCWVFGKEPNRLVALTVYNFVDPNQPLRIRSETTPTQMDDPMARNGRGIPLSTIFSRRFGVVVTNPLYAVDHIAWFHEGDRDPLENI